MDLIKLASSLKKRESSEHLMLLAKRAAGMYISKDAKSLTEAVQKSLKHEDLNEDQMRRVVEMTNQAAWKEMFQTDRQVNFEPADASSVVSSFSEEPTEVSPISMDYQTDPTPAVPEVDLEKEFGISVSDDYEKLNPDLPAQEEVAKAAAAVDASRHAVNTMERSLPELAEGFFHQVKQAYVLEGHPITKIAKAVSAATDANFSGSVMKSAADRLVDQGIRFSLEKEKTASAESVIINTDHDLIQTAVRFEKVAKSLANARDTHRKAVLRHKKAIFSLQGK